MRKGLAAIVAAIALSAAMAVPAYAGTWSYVESSGQWRYQRGATNYAYNEWVQIDGNWYYFDNSGYMQTGWTLIDNNWFYMDETGVRQTGWLLDGESWYFLYPNGVMALNTVIDGRTIGSDGVWVPEEGQAEPTNTIDLETSYLVQNMEGISTSGYTIISSGKISTGERYTNAIRLSGAGSYVQAPSDGAYRLLSGTYAPSSQFDTGILGYVYVYGDDDELLYSNLEIHYNEKPITFGVDITGHSTIRVEISVDNNNGYNTPIILFDGLAMYR